MYEASFGLKRRPFAATPDASCFLTAGPIQAALDELVICVEQGQGIAVLTAPAGSGKTLLCERLRSELDERYETVFLRHASFLTRRALLQTILCELNHAYHHPSEQELRLELFPAIRALQPKREALVLICDEAHQLTDSLLEELRILADFAEHGRPLVRLVLVGQLSLEEKLAQPSMEAINQRIRAHVSLSPFDHAATLDYIDYRITWAGGRTEEVFTPEALNLISCVSDGVPRCINQLADHTLLLAFVAEQHPAEADLVREALSDLRQLPLHWNEAPQSLESDQSTRVFQASEPQSADGSLGRDTTTYLADSTANPMTYSYEPEAKTSSHFDAPQQEVQLPEALAILEDLAASQISSIEVGSDDWRQTVESFAPRSNDIDLDEVFTDLASSVSDEESGEVAQSKLSRRLQFHDLLQDAYEAAAEAKSKLPPSDIDSVVEFVDNTPAPTTSSIPSPSGEPTNKFDSQALNSNAISFISGSSGVSSGFQEEVIIDRYASIDAGFQPPPVSFPDTTAAFEVRFEQTFPEVNVQSVTRYEPMAVSPLTVVETVSAPEEFSVPSVSEPSAESSESEPVTSTTTVESSAPFPAMGRHDTLSNDVNEVASEVYSLGQSLRPTGALSANSAAILHSLGYEIGKTETGAAAIPEKSTKIQPASTIPEPHWESTETPIVAAPTEERPFRFLFSRLRRKQQGLS